MCTRRWAAPAASPTARSATSTSSPRGSCCWAARSDPANAWVHVVDFGKPVNVCGMAVRDGDLIHADRHGAVVVPAEAVRKLPAAIDLLSRREAVILEACKRPDFGIETLRRAFAEQEDIH